MENLQLLWKVILSSFGLGDAAKDQQADMAAAYVKGNYQAAFSAATDPYYKGILLLQMGRTGEAQTELKQITENVADPHVGALANNALGQAFLEESKYEQALECFRTAQILWPERGAAERGIAELWLRHGGNSAAALRAARQGIEKERAQTGASLSAKNASLREAIGTLAWAVGVEAHDTAEVDGLVAEALALTTPGPVCCTSQMHLHFGYAFVALGESQKSTQHFETASRIDPKGLAGRSAVTAAIPTQS